MIRFGELVAARLAPRRIARTLKRTVRLLAGRDILYRYDIKLPKVRLGTMYGEWTLTPAGLNSASVVYSFGIGNDISFDLAIIERFRSKVHGFDPSPSAQSWMAQQLLPPQYNFHSFGIGEEDGDVGFFIPNSEEGMYSSTREHEGVSSVQIALPVLTLATIAKKLGTQQIDVLKIDIEGGEYSIIDQILDCPVSVRQLLIEFHHRVGVRSLSATIQAVHKLRSGGYALFHVSETSSEFSFFKL
jgi:FkbM family methyltransferase